ncbi:MAG: aminomethyl-transferring glycine dehydrogenase subunit GcvPA [Candidatus Bathyarchaeota archaeon]|nr:aminomethyl-transferring glycine dehydrogenase subunit GcvPA [Candidatus Bathyarchaeota archaeon]
MKDKDFTHPYIPNSVPEIKAEMLRMIGAPDADALYREMIPERLLLKKPMDLPEAITSELDLRRHVEEILAKNKTTDDYISFLGAGCWNHYVPKVCEVIANRSEFLTAYAGGPHSDLGRYQANFEFQSLICELLGMEVSGIPTYDWGAAAGNSIRMASRLTGRNEVIMPRNMSPARLSILRNFCDSASGIGRIEIKLVDYDRETGMVNLGELESKITEQTAAVYFENPNYLGVIEVDGKPISEIAHDHGAESVCGVDPISLGVLAPPSDYGVDIACGEAQPLGIHMYAGGGSCGFIASRDDERYVAEYPLRLVCVTENKEDDEYAFGLTRHDRTSYMARENAKDWVGTTTALWGITAGVYMSLMGPEGMREVGETILQKSHYTAEVIEEIPGVEVPFGSFFKEFPVKFNKPVKEINEDLLGYKIFGGKDLTAEYPELDESALYCVTEMHNLTQIETLVDALKEVLA